MFHSPQEVVIETWGDLLGNLVCQEMLLLVLHAFIFGSYDDLAMHKSTIRKQSSHFVVFQFILLPHKVIEVSIVGRTQWSWAGIALHRRQVESMQSRCEEFSKN